MSSHTLAVADLFHVQYQITVHLMEAPHPLAKLVNISRMGDADRLLRRFNLKRSEWTLLLFLLNHNSIHMDHDDIVNTLAPHLIHRTIKIFELPRLDKCLVQDDKGEAYAFVRAPAVDKIVSDAQLLSIDSMGQAKEFVQGLNQDLSFWASVLEQNGIERTQSDSVGSPDVLNKVYENLVSRELLVYDMPFEEAPPKPENIPEVPARIVPWTLGPHDGPNKPVKKTVASADEDAKVVVEDLEKALGPVIHNTRALPGNEGHSWAGTVSEGGSGTALSGHGAKFLDDGYTIVPEGTTITLPRENISILDRTGQYIEKGDWEGLGKLAKFDQRVARDIEGITTWLPGSKVPEYTLFTPDARINLFKNSRTVNQPTPLSEILEPNQGSIQWGVCTKFLDFNK